MSDVIRNDTYLTVREAAQRWNVHPNTIRNAITRGRLKASRFGARIIRIRVADLDAIFTPYKGGEHSTWKRA